MSTSLAKICLLFERLRLRGFENILPYIDEWRERGYLASNITELPSLRELTVTLVEKNSDPEHVRELIKELYYVIEEDNQIDFKLDLEENPQATRWEFSRPEIFVRVHTKEERARWWEWYLDRVDIAEDLVWVKKEAERQYIGTK